MRAVRLHDVHSPLEDVEVPLAPPAPGEIVVDVRAAGICHSDVHYRDEPGRVRLPITLGHEVAGVVREAGPGVTACAPGDRVAIHYLMPGGAMLGHGRDGGYAEAIVVPAAVAVRIPDNVPFDHAAIMMCSTATAWHALKQSDLRQGDSLAILGFGGLGISAVQLAGILGATRIVAVDVVESKLRLAEEWGAVAVDGRGEDLDSALHEVDVVIDLAGHAPTTLRALRALAPRGRLIVVAINLRGLEIDPYADVLCPERRIIGSSDHTYDELVELMELASGGRIDLSRAITRTVPLAAAAIDAVLDDLRRGTSHLRTVIRP